jgi:hypothetical protein|tara:strand:- start:1868 stop:2188 length:321 start_codon:yes stop_codon:yes gene_type:complete
MYDNAASKIYSAPVAGWGNPTWVGGKVRSLLQWDGVVYYSVLDSYADEFKASVSGEAVVTNKYVLQQIAERSPKIMGDATNKAALGVDEGASASAIATDKATYEAA